MHISKIFIHPPPEQNGCSVCGGDRLNGNHPQSKLGAQLSILTPYL